MAETYESYEVYIRSDRDEEFRTFMKTHFTGAYELNWRDSTEVDEDLSDESYELYLDSDRGEEFSALFNEQFNGAGELNWRETLEA